MNDILSFLKNDGLNYDLAQQVEQFRAQYPLREERERNRIPNPVYYYYGIEIWEDAIAAILAGEHLLLIGPKATGKNILAEGLCSLFQRPCWDISFYLNADASSLIGTDTLTKGEVRFRPGPIYRCAQAGGFGVLDEINMAKNESLAVLHATLDFRRIIDVPGYDKIELTPETRFIATMNYGYAGTRELNEALSSRFMVINLPIITYDNLIKLLSSQYPDLNKKYAEQLSSAFFDIRTKCENSELSTKALDLRGLIASLELIKKGLTVSRALTLGIVNKTFDDFERQIVSDIISTRIDGSLKAKDIFKV